MANETLDAAINARVTKSLNERIAREVRYRRRLGEWVSVADIIRDALHKYFAARPNEETQTNGQH